MNTPPTFAPNSLWAIDGQGNGRLLPWKPGEVMPKIIGPSWLHLSYADETARDVDHILRRRRAHARSGNVPVHSFFTTADDVEEFRRFGGRVLARPMDVVAHVDLPAL